MKDIRCPRCGSLMGRVNGEAQLRCKRARCYAIVNVNTHTGEATMIRYGAGNSYTRCNEKTTLDEIDAKYIRGEFAEYQYFSVALTTFFLGNGEERRLLLYTAERTALPNAIPCREARKTTQED